MKGKDSSGKLPAITLDKEREDTVENRSSKSRKMVLVATAVTMIAVLAGQLLAGPANIMT